MPITENEIVSCIAQLKNNKSSRDDLILNEFLKSTYHIFSSVYVKSFNIILNTGCIPKSWLEGDIFPINKQKGDKKLADNYKGITILSCFGQNINDKLLNVIFNLYKHA